MKRLFVLIPVNEDKKGYFPPVPFFCFYRFPIGIVLAITPFNDPLNLVAHKLGPAIAAGNAVVIFRPDTFLPLSFFFMCGAGTIRLCALCGSILLNSRIYHTYLLVNAG